MTHNKFLTTRFFFALFFVLIFGALLPKGFIMAADYSKDKGVYHFDDSGNLGFDSSVYGQNLSYREGLDAVYDAGGKFGGAVKIIRQGAPLKQEGGAAWSFNTNGVSLMFWLKSPSPGSMNEITIRGAGGTLIECEVTNYDIEVHIYSSKPWRGFMFVGNLEDGNWHQVVLTYNSTSNIVKCYVDGEYKSQHTVGDFQSDYDSLNIFYWIHSGPDKNVYFDDVVLTAQELTQDDVTAAFNAPYGGQIKEVPLYTQLLSPYPSENETKTWFNEKYADGNSDCGYSIAKCGCALTSSVMVARYYDVTETRGNDVNPRYLNEWLRTEPGGYGKSGDVNWLAVAKYTNGRIKYEKTDKNTNNYALLNEYLSKNQPVIAKENAGRGGIGKNHFIVIDKKIADTFGVKDPAWYNTQTLNQITDKINKIRGYENSFDGLRIYKKGDGLAQAAITFALGSPAELLITDPLGKKLGKDANGVEYQEIPSASYFEDGFDDPTEENPPSQERSKLIQILEPVDGTYNIQVIGTGAGVYTLQSASYDHQGNAHAQTLTGNTEPNLITDYNFTFTPEQINIEPKDQIPPTTNIFLGGILGNNNWYTSDVQVSLSAQDNEGGMGVYKIEYSLDNGQTWLTYTEPFLISTEGVQTILYRSQDFVGNLEQAKSQTIQIDQTKPTVTASRTPAANASGWNNTDVTVSFSGTDNLSGIDSCSQPVTVSSEGANQSVSGTCTDKAGNVSDPATISGINIDKTPPQLQLSASPSILWPPNNKLVKVAVGGSAQDSLSGIASTSFKVTDEYGKVEPIMSNFGDVIQLEASRGGDDKDGRLYTIFTTTTDKAGNQSTSSTTVICPHDQGK